MKLGLNNAKANQWLRALQNNAEYFNNKCLVNGVNWSLGVGGGLKT